MSTHSHHVPTVPMCLTVFGSLLALTALTVWAAGIDFGAINTPIALLIAIAKGSLVMAFFMGAKWSTPLTKAVAASGFIWLLIMFGITMSDYLTRGWLGVPGR